MFAKKRRECPRLPAERRLGGSQQEASNTMGLPRSAEHFNAIGDPNTAHGIFPRETSPPVGPGGRSDGWAYLASCLRTSSLARAANRRPSST